MSATVQLPLIMLHVPVPVTGRLPDKPLVVTLHRCWSDPAFAVVAGVATLMVTSSVLAAHGLLLIVQRNMVVLPLLNPLTPLVEEVVLVITHVPLTILHTPVPVVAVLPDKIVTALLHRYWSIPASDTVG